MPAKPIEMPARIARLPRDRRGYPIPRFVEEPVEPDGEVDFRVMSMKHFRRCVQHKVCWVCGEPLGGMKAFVVGPMCCVNHVSAEPPSHYDCARYSVQACPFLSLPKAKRREANLPDKVKDPAGIMISRNPGTSAVWVCKDYELQAVSNGVLVHMGEPLRIEFWAWGRPATRAEVEESVRTGLPALVEVAEQQGPDAMKELERQRQRFEARLDEAIPRTVAMPV